MTWPRLSMNKIWGETHVEDTTYVEDKFKQVDWAQLSRLLPEDGDRIQSPKRCF
jgi:hypothetical protein